MHIGVPKEVKVAENRVGLTPASVREICHRGHGVTVEHDAGIGIGASDDDYRREGATIAASAADVFACCDMIVKVKEPQAAERAMLRPGQVLFTYLHLAPDPDQARDLIASGAVCIAYETVTSAAPDAIDAPARRYASSSCPMPAPAPRSTTTAWPWWTSSPTDAGVSPTRCSSTLISFGTPTRMRSPFLRRRVRP